MYYIVYLTTNLVNLKIYVGKHSTYNLEDGYLGSGKALKSAIKKYGKENFKRTILHFCCDINHLNEIESLIVDQEFIERENTYNITLGGDGSFEHINNDKETYSSNYFKLKFNEWWDSLSIDERDKHKIIRQQNGHTSMKGRTHSKETIEKTKHVGNDNPNSYYYLKHIKGLTDDEILNDRKKHISYKKYKIIYPDNTIFEGEISLKQLCLDNDMNYNTTQAKVKKNKFKNINGWSISCIP